MYKIKHNQDQTEKLVLLGTTNLHILNHSV